jgi:hypothetical protein
VAAFTLTRTYQPATTPPSVRIDIHQTDTPAVSSVTVNRIDPDGVTRPVRTTDGNPVPISATNGSITDYETPYGQTVTYTLSSGTVTPVTALLDSALPWLTHVGIPSRSVTLSLRKGSNDSEDWKIEQGVFSPLNRTRPLIITGGARQAPASSLIVQITTPAAKSALQQLLADGSPLLLNVSPTLGLGIDTAYVAVGNVRQARPSDIGTDPWRDFVLEYQVVDRPAGGARAPVTWADVAAKYATWSSIPAGTTWAQLAAGA